LSDLNQLNNYDILWNNGEMFGALFCRKIRDKYGIPFVCTFHGNESMLMVMEGLTKPDVYAVLTPHYKTFLERKIKGNIICIPNGVDLKFYNPNYKPLKKYGIDELDRPIFLSTSALTPSKRVDLIVKAVSKLDKGSLVFTSTGSMEHEILELASKKLKGRHQYLGVIPFEELPSLYNSCDIYVNASKAEGHSLAVLEALACNLPVVSHNDANRKWAIGNAGIVTDVTNIDRFTSALKTIYETEWDNIPRKHAEEFSWEKTVDAYEKEINNLCSKKFMEK
jgi:glycosyltransferase involved in cell wall biosynthesis